MPDNLHPWYSKVYKSLCLSVSQTEFQLQHTKEAQFCQDQQMKALKCTHPSPLSQIGQVHFPIHVNIATRLDLHGVCGPHVHHGWIVGVGVQHPQLNWYVVDIACIQHKGKCVSTQTHIHTEYSRTVTAYILLSCLILSNSLLLLASFYWHIFYILIQQKYYTTYNFLATTPSIWFTGLYTTDTCLCCWNVLRIFRWLVFSNNLLKYAYSKYCVACALYIYIFSFGLTILKSSKYNLDNVVLADYKNNIQLIPLYGTGIVPSSCTRCLLVPSLKTET